MKWSEVGIGDIVLSAKDNKAWELVDKAASGAYTLENAQERQFTFTPPPDGEVEVIASASEAKEAAVAAVEDVLGGQTIASRDSDQRWYAPESFPDAATLLGHLMIFHARVRPKDTHVRDLIADHRALHDPGGENAEGFFPHEHTRNFDEPSRRNR